jgi:hypothetical protein
MDLTQIGHLGHAPEFRRRDFIDGSEDRGHRIIDPDIDAAPFRGGALGRGEHLLGLGDVGNERKCLAADPLDLRPRAFQALAAPRQEGDAPAAPRKGQRGGAADPGRRSSNDDYGS